MVNILVYYYIIIGVIIRLNHVLRVNGHEKDNIQTYGMVTGLLNGGLGLGAMVGPIMSGAITDATDFTWAMTVWSGIGLAMVRFLKLANVKQWN